jgi:phage regulatory protein, rha family
MTDSLPTVAVLDGIPRVSSLDIARHFEKSHRNVLAAIRKIMDECPPEFRELNFKPTFRTVAGPNNSERQESCFDLTRDAFTLLAMGFTGKKALGWKLKYIEAFNTMENHIATGNKALQSDMAALKKELADIQKRLSPGKKKALPNPGPSYEEECAKATHAMLALQKDVFEAGRLVASVFRKPFWLHIGEADYLEPNKGTPREKFACSMNYAIQDYFMAISKSVSTAGLLFNAYVEAERLLPR